MTAELQQARFFPVQFESKLLEPRSHRVPEAPRIGFVLEANNDVIGISHDYHVAACLSPSPSLGPKVEDVVQVDVGKQRRDDATYAKGNFEFERRISLCRTRSILDLRHKK